MVLGSLDFLALLIDAVFLDSEEAGRFYDDLDAEVFPGEFRGISLGEDLDYFAVNGYRILGCGFDVTGNLPWTESYFKRYALVFASVISFTATNSRSLLFFSSIALATRRPILPKPLIPTFTAISTSSFLFCFIYRDTSLKAQAAISGGVWFR